MSIRLLTVAAAMFCMGTTALAASAEPDTCIAFITTNLAKGRGNWYTYYRFSKHKVKVKTGDVLTYRIFLDPRNPEAKGGIDAEFEGGGPPLRDLKINDDQGRKAHGDGDLSAASGKWLTRKIDISVASGRTVATWQVHEEGDKDGRYAQFVDDVMVIHADGSRTVIYENGPIEVGELDGANGYTNEPTCVAINSAKVKDGALIDPVIEAAEILGRRMKALNDARKQVEYARKFAERDADTHLKQHIEEAAAALAKAEREDATAEELQAALHTAADAVSHTHPVMQKYVGHLVGHAHIDLQWLWEWQEGIVFTRDTFAQAVKFMDEFPGFTFSQSSSCLYQATEEHYPALFKKIQEKVRAGQWELVGGRICEGDENMISEESSARQFLYGQSYFREKFGKMATVGWEPDTFGHTFQMPQMLKLAGIESYYFCRGGKGKPLFWWEGLDGTRVLAFDEPASGSWYNSDLSYKQFQEMLDFEKSTGSKDSLWVYGVGNHGGGPTREHIQWVMDQLQTSAHPDIKFSTASQFFEKLRTYDLTKIPVVHEEMNPVFDGCYTTHSEVKQLNRNAEAMTTSAEAVATVASLWGFAYPRAAFRRNWEDICFNHHHDTLPGSGNHAPYAKTRTTLERVIAEDRDIITRAMEAMVVQVTPKAGGVNVMVFNPTGFERSDWVETYLVKSGWDNTPLPDPERCVAVGPDGAKHPATLVDKPSRRVRFWGAGIPAYGYRVFHLESGEPARNAMEVRDGGATIETEGLVIEFDRESGVIKRCFDRAEKIECGNGLGRLEVAWEDVQGMSAWTLGKISKVDALKPTSANFARGVDFAEATFTYVLPAWNASGGESRITQKFRIAAGSKEITCDVDCDWNGVGTNQSPNAMLRVAFATSLADATATYHVPFGALSRKTDGREMPALQWADLSTVAGGLTIFNDSKHGFAAKGQTMTMSLIRSSFEPDPVPNPGHHHWRYAIMPHAGSWESAELTQRAAAFNQPLVAATVPYDAKGELPPEWSVLSEMPRGVMASCLKRAERDEDVVIRVYEPTGAAVSGELKLAIPVGKSQVVNFIEDPTQSGDDSEGKAGMKLRPFEIRTMKFSLGAGAPGK